MSDSRDTRPVSGEIMTGGAAGTARAAQDRADVVDAEYETLAPGSPDRPAAPVHASAAGPAAPPRGLETLRRDRGGSAAGAPPERRGRRGGPAFWAAGLSAVAIAFWMSGGHALVGPAVERAAPARGLAIAELETRVERHAGRALLLVDGAAVNEGGSARALPDLSIEVLGHDGRTTRYFLGTNGHRLAPGGRFPFSSRLQVAGEGVKSVSVSFAKKGR
ncbi:hypothetical protein N1F89_19845 [Aquibium sp. A9E412]|uniref:hypothetical protein n=1 Tax=Aquibium sp. A9E412 TaxID=2976767 RepID=UPI0025B098A3|nr:hypothetical protein [Aquibium sp. A9E412]MDN2568483.1 hypothetical protein [Aquibium sp. A9E412]